MEFFIATVISGIAVGMLYGLLGSAVTILYKSTGVISFAVPAVATFLAFVSFLYLRDTGLALGWALLLSLVTAGLLGVGLYLLVMRPFSRYGVFSLILRTIAVSFCVEQLVVYLWSEGEPFTFPQLWNGPSLELGAVLVPRQTVTILAVTAVLLGGLALFFTRSRTGLLLRAIADSSDSSALLGVNVRAMTAVAWAISSGVALVVAVLAAPTLLVSSSMFAPFVLYSFTAFILGGIATWSGSIVGGLIVGIVSTLGLAYGSLEVSALVTFAILLGILILKPSGLLGSTVAERL